MPLLLLIIAIPIVYILIKMVQSSSPKGFAKGIAHAQLMSLYAFKNKYPDEKDTEKQYVAALTQRPGYTEEKVKEIIKSAKQASKESGIKFNFQVVVIQMVANEYMEKTGNSPISVMNDINLGVTSTIPNNL